MLLDKSIIPAALYCHEPAKCTWNQTNTKSIQNVDPSAVKSALELKKHKSIV